jgi:ABC-type uncharacterized transport system substrate-binding protein
MRVIFQGKELQGVAFQWTFDEVFSALILADYQPEGDGTFKPKVAQEVRKGAFDNLANFHYYLSFSVANKPIGKIAIEQFVPSVTPSGRLVYAFFVPLHLKSISKDQAVRITVYDDTYYTAFDILHAEQVKVDNDASVSVVLKVEKTKVPALWPGQYMPDQLIVTFQSTP